MSAYDHVRRSSSQTRLRSVGLTLLPIALLLIVWLLFTDITGIANKLKVPYPSNLLGTVEQLGPYIFVHLGATAMRLYAGLLIGVVLGIACGLAMIWSQVFGRLIDPIIEMIRPIPALAFIPFFILWMGIGDAPKVLLVALGCFLTMVVITVEAARNLPPVYVRAARTLGASSARIYRTVVLPGIFPSLFGGIRLSSGLSFTLVVAAEFMGAQQGLGYMILVAQRTLSTSAILYGIVVIALLSFVTDLLIRLFGRLAMRWTERE